MAAAAIAFTLAAGREMEAAFLPSSDAAWSMVVVPDTQNYVKDTAYNPILTQMTEWIRDHRDEWKIQLVLQEGDIVNQNSQITPTSGNQTATQQWTNARAAFSVLNGHVPYIMAAGNHDMGSTSAQDRSTRINNFFPPSANPLVDPAQGGILKGTMEPGHIENAYYDFVAPDGRPMLIFSLEFGPRQHVVNWANTIAGRPEYANHTAVLLTHAYMYHDETRYDWNRNLDTNSNNDQGGNPHEYPVGYDVSDGEELWNELVRRHENFELVFNGHVGGDGVGRLTSVGDAGNQVHQMLFNTQFEANGGNGWFRVLEFLNDGISVRIRTYSPFHDTTKPDAANQFMLLLSEALPGDYNDDGAVDIADYIVWRNTNFQLVVPGSGADGDRNGRIDTGDYDLWRHNFGRTQQVAGATAAIAAPEPTFVALLLPVALLVSVRVARP